MLWHDGRSVNDKPYAAIVTAGGLNGVVDLLAFPLGSYGGLPKSGVRFHEDPDKRAIHNTEDGVWSLTERAKRAAVQAHRVNTLPPAKPR